MFDVGFSELVLLFVIGLLILGPERLPRVAAKLGRWVGHARRTATQLRLQFEREMTMQDIMSQQRKPPQKPVAPKEEDTAADREGDAEATSQSDEPQSDASQGDVSPSSERKHDERGSGNEAQAERDPKAVEQADESR